jgi:hypothetical protein
VEFGSNKTRDRGQFGWVQFSSSDQRVNEARGSVQTEGLS